MQQNLNDNELQAHIVTTVLGSKKSVFESLLQIWEGKIVYHTCQVSTPTTTIEIICNR